eukprot:TRINITY_DN14148_c0_g1_i2.p1 TRINITY_DN14148_c0_g1~~TRINITY_DN14148_c0_g1_i2.p1  ORF type:complete len:425 (+),score=78.81 TRINITY_DN14148_c0_g1_i2:74-1276(+)
MGRSGYQHVDSKHTQQFEQILCEGEEIQFATATGTSCGQKALFVYMVLMMVLFLGIGAFMVVFLGYFEHMYGFGVGFGAMMVALSGLFVWILMRTYALVKYHVITNYRVMNVSLWSGRATTVSIPYTSIAVIDNSKTGSLTMRANANPAEEGTGKGRIILSVEFHSLSLSDHGRAYSLVSNNVEAAKAGTGPRPRPLDLHNRTFPSLSNVPHSFQRVLDEHAPLLWANKPSIWSNWGVIIVCAFLMIFLLLGVFMSAGEHWYTLLQQPVILGMALFMPIFYVVFLALLFNKMRAVNAVTRNGLLVVRTGMKLNKGCVIGDNYEEYPFRDVWPLTANISFKKGDGTLMWARGRLTFFSEVSDVMTVQDMILAGAAHQATPTPGDPSSLKGHGHVILTMPHH